VTGVGPGTSLADKVINAQAALAAADTTEACSALSAMIHELRAQSGKKIPTAQAAALIVTAERIRTVLRC